MFSYLCIMALTMGILNLTPDSFYEPSRYDMSVFESGVDIVDIGAVSTRPGAAPVSLEDEWSRLEPVLSHLPENVPRISIDTTRSEIVRRAYPLIGPFIVNDISAGEYDADMLPLVGSLGLSYIAMHKRGNPSNMDSLCDYGAFATVEHPSGVIPALLEYFASFAEKAAKFGISDWILDPGLGFAKTPEQCWEILDKLECLSVFGRPILIGAADKRFTRFPPAWAVYSDGNALASEIALRHGAAILRVHL